MRNITRWILDTEVKVFHESISYFMNWPWNCISWNALKEKFHNVSFPINNVWFRVRSITKRETWKLQCSYMVHWNTQWKVHYMLHESNMKNTTKITNLRDGNCPDSQCYYTLNIFYCQRWHKFSALLFYRH